MTMESVKGILAQVDATVQRSEAGRLPSIIDGKTTLEGLTGDVLSAAADRASELLRFTDEVISPHFVAARHAGSSVVRGLMASQTGHSEIISAAGAAGDMSQHAVKGESAAALMSDSMEIIVHLLGQLSQEIGVYTEAERQVVEQAGEVQNKAIQINTHIDTYRMNVGISEGTSN